MTTLGSHFTPINKNLNGKQFTAHSLTIHMPELSRITVCYSSLKKALSSMTPQQTRHQETRNYNLSKQSQLKYTGYCSTQYAHKKVHLCHNCQSGLGDVSWAMTPVLSLKPSVLSSHPLTTEIHKECLPTLQPSQFDQSLAFQEP